MSDVPWKITSHPCVCLGISGTLILISPKIVSPGLLTICSGDMVSEAYIMGEQRIKRHKLQNSMLVRYSHFPFFLFP
ncbi:hypothetical protein [Marmot herpesvirus 1]|nr:hypothetical protein [Marmot herpesvirus 1]